MNKKALTLSIVIPVYNEEHHIGACLRSIAAQTEMPDEVIVVNNNCTDGSMDIVAKFPFVRVVAAKQQGIVYARDAGFDAAHSDILGRIDADTVLPPGWVAYVKRFFHTPEHASMALTGGGGFYNIRLYKFNSWVQGQIAFRMNRLIMGHYILWGSNMALPKVLWQEVQATVCRRNDIHEDVDLAIHLNRAGVPIVYRESLRTGQYLKRVWENQSQRREHMAKWPRTLRVHGLRLWWLGTVGNMLLNTVVYAIVMVAEGVSRLMGKPSIAKR